MAISLNQIQFDNDEVDSTYYLTTNSWTPDGGALTLLLLGSRAGNTTTPPTLDIEPDGCSMNWVLEEAVDDGGGTFSRKWYLYRAMGGTPSYDYVDWQYSLTQRACVYEVLEFDGVETSGSDGENAIAQSDWVYDDTVSDDDYVASSLAAFGDAGNWTIMFGMGDDATYDTVGSGDGFTEMQDDTGSDMFHSSYYKNSNDTSPTYQVNCSGAGTEMGNYSLEIVVASGVGATPKGIFGLPLDGPLRRVVYS